MTLRLNWSRPEPPIVAAWRPQRRGSAVAPASPPATEAAIIGPPGARGARGQDGARLTIEFSPPAALATWLIPHELGRPPVVQVLTPDGEAVGCRVRHLSADVASIEFANPTSGTAYLS